MGTEFDKTAGGGNRTFDSEKIRQEQSRLRDAGFDPGPVDGILGPRTKAAMERYRSDRVRAVLPATLYLQEVLRYSAIKTGVAFIAITVTIVVVSNLGQALTTRLGARPVLSAGLLLTAAGGALYAQMPADGHYFWDVFPGLILSGIGLALSFVPVTIASLNGVQPADAGVASGLINTSRQIGGSVGIAAVTAIAATATSHYADSHAVLAVSGPALTHGFQVAFYTLVGLALVGRGDRRRLRRVQAEGGSDGETGRGPGRAQGGSVTWPTR